MDTFTLDKIEFSAVRLILSRFAATSLGKRLCLRITPSRNPEIIAKWQGQTAQMIDAIISVGLPPLAGVTDITQTLARAVPAGPATGEDYADIASTLASASNVRGYLLPLADSMELLIALGAEIDEFAPLVEAIAGVVATDGSIRDDASPRLSQIRREVANLGQEIHDVMYGYLRRPEVTRLLQHATVTLHGDRYVLPVKAENRGRRLKGELSTVSHPDKRIEFVVERINPVAEVVENRNVFKVRVRLVKVEEWMRPGMEGVARISIDRRRYAWIWTRRLINWVRMKLWL